MYFIKRPTYFGSLNYFVRSYSTLKKSHYEVLNLRRNCTDKEIKDAFIQMSKEYHPDKNKDSKAQEKFVQIVQAYNVLSKPNSRSQYDHVTEVSAPSYVYRSHVAYNVRNNNYGYGFHYDNTYSQTKTNYNTKQANTNTGYYGFSGIRRLPNIYIIAICLGFAIIGVVLQLFVIRNTYVLQRRRANEKSKLLAEELEKVRQAALDNGNELQTRLLLDKIVAASNPTVSTATLGQALANEKKDPSETLLTEFGVSDPVEDWTYKEDLQENDMNHSE